HGQIGMAPVCARSPDLVEPAVAVVPQVVGSAIHAGYVEPGSVHRGPCHAEHGIGRVKERTRRFEAGAVACTAAAGPTIRACTGFLGKGKTRGIAHSSRASLAAPIFFNTVPFFFSFVRP